MCPYFLCICVSVSHFFFFFFLSAIFFVDNETHTLQFSEYHKFSGYTHAPEMAIRYVTSFFWLSDQMIYIWPWLLDISIIGSQALAADIFFSNFVRLIILYTLPQRKQILWLLFSNDFILRVNNQRLKFKLFKALELSSMNCVEEI